MLDFFDPPDDQCQMTAASRMYLHDFGDASPAVLLARSVGNRPVVVENSSCETYVFRPVDKVVYGPADSKRGDVFFHSSDRLSLIFAELKLWHVSGWFKAGVAQLKSVVLDFIDSHPSVYAASRVRRAYVCNPYHPHFAYSHAEEMRDFHRNTRFSLFPEGSIKIS